MLAFGTCLPNTSSRPMAVGTMINQQSLSAEHWWLLAAVTGWQKKTLVYNKVTVFAGSTHQDRFSVIAKENTVAIPWMWNPASTVHSALDSC